MHDEEFVEGRRLHLVGKLRSKIEIFARGGELAALHEPGDITRVKFALRRITEGQYGLCTHCGVIIEQERLIQLPETPFCTPCATSIEQDRSRTH